MSEKSALPEQLMLPLFDEPFRSSAQVLFLHKHRNHVENSVENNSIPKDQERKIIDKILERADRLSWYK